MIGRSSQNTGGSSTQRVQLPSASTGPSQNNVPTGSLSQSWPLSPNPGSGSAPACGTPAAAVSMAMVIAVDNRLDQNVTVRFCTVAEVWGLGLVAWHRPPSRGSARYRRSGRRAQAAPAGPRGRSEGRRPVVVDPPGRLFSAHPGGPLFADPPHFVDAVVAFHGAGAISPHAWRGLVPNASHARAHTCRTACPSRQRATVRPARPGPAVSGRSASAGPSSDPSRSSTSPTPESRPYPPSAPCGTKPCSLLVTCRLAAMSISPSTSGKPPGPRAQNQ